MKQFKTYEEAVRYLYGLQKYGIKFGLSKTENLLAAVGNPHKGRAYVHIAGTNGKGSIAAFLSSILSEAGFRVGLYSSPHLVRFTERFRINGEEISKDEVITLVNTLMGAIVQEEPPTFFEATTAMALTYFARQDTDIAIMEVGMGGRLDATNVIRPLITVISNIAMDHQMFLGNNLCDIAREKAGIIKSHVPLVTGVKQGKVVEVLREICREASAPMVRLGEQVRFQYRDSRFFYYGQGLRLKGLELGLKGRFQARNAAIALAVTEQLGHKGFSVGHEAMVKGLRKAWWPGRMHIASTQPLILLDGAHNPEAMGTLAAAVKREFTYGRLILVVGVMEDKEIGQILKQIVPMAHHVIYTRPRYSRAATPERLFDYGKNMHKSAEIVPFLDEAITKAKHMAQGNDLILICGSLFTVGEAMSHLDPVNYRPEEL